MSTAHDDEQGEYMSPVETARALGVSIRTLRRYRSGGLIVPHHHTPSGHARFLAADVRRLRDQPKRPQAVGA